MGIGKRHSKLCQPVLDIRPRCADELTTRKSIVAGHLVKDKVRDDQGIGFRVGVELCFGQSQALKCAFKDVDAKRRDAIANLTEHLCREPSQQTKLRFGEVNIRN